MNLHSQKKVWLWGLGWLGLVCATAHMHDCVAVCLVSCCWAPEHVFMWSSGLVWDCSAGPEFGILGAFLAVATATTGNLLHIGAHSCFWPMGSASTCDLLHCIKSRHLCSWWKALMVESAARPMSYLVSHQHSMPLSVLLIHHLMAHIFTQDTCNTVGGNNMAPCTEHCGVIWLWACCYICAHGLAPPCIGSVITLWCTAGIWPVANGQLRTGTDQGNPIV